MGYGEDHWILVSGNDFTARGELSLAQAAALGNGPQPVRWAHDVAIRVFGIRRPTAVSTVMLSAINHQEYFSIAPDGSKAGWEESDEHDVLRSQFLASLIVGYVRHKQWTSWNVVRLGADMDDTSLFRNRHPMIFTLCEGEKLNPVTLDDARHAVEFLVPGVQGKTWKHITTTPNYDVSEFVRGATMVAAQMLNIPDKYGVIGRPDSLNGTEARQLYDSLLDEAQAHFPGAHPSAL